MVCRAKESAVPVDSPELPDQTVLLGRKEIKAILEEVGYPVLLASPAMALRDKKASLEILVYPVTLDEPDQSVHQVLLVL